MNEVTKAVLTGVAIVVSAFLISPWLFNGLIAYNKFVNSLF